MPEWLTESWHKLDPATRRLILWLTAAIVIGLAFGLFSNRLEGLTVGTIILIVYALFNPDLSTRRQ